MSVQRRLNVSPPGTRPVSMQDLPGQLDAIIRQWPTRTYNEDDVPVILGADIPDVLLEWSQRYNGDVPLLDPDDDATNVFFEAEHIKTFPLTPDQVFHLVLGLQGDAARRTARNADDDEVSQLVSMDQDQEVFPSTRGPPTPSQIPLPVGDDQGSDSPPEDMISSQSRRAVQGFELFGEEAVMSTPARHQRATSHATQLEQFQFGSPQASASAGHMERLRTTSNPETPPRKPKSGHKVYESRGDVPSAPSSWRHSRPAAPSKRRNSQSGHSSREGSDTEDTFSSRKAPSGPTSPLSTTSQLSPAGGLFQELESFPHARALGHSFHPSFSAVAGSSEFYNEHGSHPQLQEGDSVNFELDEDSFHDMESTFATNPDVIPGDISISRLHAYIRTCSRLLNQRTQLLQDTRSQLEKVERDKMLLGDDLEERGIEVERTKQELKDLRLEEAKLNQQISSLEYTLGLREHDNRKLDNRLLDMKEQLEKSRTACETHLHNIAMKDGDINRLKDSEAELHNQIEEVQRNAADLERRHSADREKLTRQLDEAAHEISTLQGHIDELEREKDTESGKAQTAEAALATLNATIQAESSKKSRMSNKSPLANEFGQEDTDAGTLVEGSPSDAEESTDADNETFVTQTHTVIRRKRPRKSISRAGAPSVATEIEESRTFAEMAVQCEPFEHASTEATQTESSPELVDITMQTDRMYDLTHAAIQTEAPPAGAATGFLDSPESDEPFPSTSLLDTRVAATTVKARKATQAETELERKWLFKWHEHLVIPIEGLAKGVTDDAAAEWEALKHETGRGCTVIDQLLDRSKKVGPRPGSKLALKTRSVGDPAFESDTEVEDVGGTAKGPKRAGLRSRDAVKSGQGLQVADRGDSPFNVGSLWSAVNRLISAVYPPYASQLASNTHSSLFKALPLNRTTALWILLIFALYTFIILHYATILNPAAYYPGVSYRDRALWTSYHRYATQRRYGAPRMTRTAPVSDPVSRVWWYVVDWATSG